MVDKLIECQHDKCTDVLKTEYFFLIKFSENILQFLGSKISKYQKGGLKMFFKKLNDLDGLNKIKLASRLEKLIQSVSN